MHGQVNEAELVAHHFCFVPNPFAHRVVTESSPEDSLSEARLVRTLPFKDGFTMNADEADGVMHSPKAAMDIA